MIDENRPDAGTQMLLDLGIALEAPELTELVSPVEGLLPSVVSLNANTLADPGSVSALDSPPEFSVQRMIFTAMLEQVMQVVPTRDVYPQVKNVKIDVFDARLVLTGSDSTLSVISSTTTVRVTRPGRVLIGGTRFANVIRRATGPEITIRCEGNAVHLSSGSASWSLRVAAEQDYPSLPDVGDITWYEIDRSAFVRALAGTRYVVSKDGTKDHIMQLDIAGGVVTATDDTRFAQVRDDLPVEFSCQLPASGADLLVKMLERNDSSQFRMADTDFHIFAEIGPPHTPDRAIIAHLMNPFPPEARLSLDSALSANRDVLTLVADELIEVLQQAAPTSDDETGAIALRVGTPELGKVTINSRNRYGDHHHGELEGSFLVSGTDQVASSRTVIVSGAHLRDAVRASVAASGVSEEADGAGTVLLFLGLPRSRSRPAPVLVSDSSRQVNSVLSQLRSDWLD